VESNFSLPAQTGKHAPKQNRVSNLALYEMRRVSNSMNCVTDWLRVAKSGQGQDVWRTELESKGLVVVHALSPAEGTYVMIPESTSPEEMVSVLLQINMTVRRKTYFEEMKRANKSRVVFKYEPFTVDPKVADDKPILVPTTRFSNCAWQPVDILKLRLEETNSSPSTGEGRGDTSARNENNDGASVALSMDSLNNMVPMLDRMSRDDYAKLNFSGTQL
jgi:hypothetical protein